MGGIPVIVLDDYSILNPLILKLCISQGKQEASLNLAKNLFF